MLATVAVGTLVHELAHAVVLSVLGVEYSIDWLPNRRDRGGSRTVLPGAVAVVTPARVPDAVSPLGLRLAALAPVALAAPLGLVPLGVLPDPVAGGNPLLIAGTVAWLACAIPSPQDFSVVWYADRALPTESTSMGGTDPCARDP